MFSLVTVHVFLAAMLAAAATEDHSSKSALQHSDLVMAAGQGARVKVNHLIKEV